MAAAAHHKVQQQQRTYQQRVEELKEQCGTLHRRVAELERERGQSAQPPRDEHARSIERRVSALQLQERDIAKKLRQLQHAAHAAQRQEKQGDRHEQQKEAHRRGQGREQGKRDGQQALLSLLVEERGRRQAEVVLLRRHVELLVQALEQHGIVLPQQLQTPSPPTLPSHYWRWWWWYLRQHRPRQWRRLQRCTHMTPSELAGLLPPPPASDPERQKLVQRVQEAAVAAEREPQPCQQAFEALKRAADRRHSDAACWTIGGERV